MLVTAAAPLALSVARVHGVQHAIALLPACHLGPDLLDDTAELVPEYERGLDLQTPPRPVSGPEVPVGSADAVRLDAHDNAVRWALRVGHFADDERFADSFYDGCTHGMTPRR